MMNAGKLAIALLALVGILAVAGPVAAVSGTFKLKVYNHTHKKDQADKGMKIKVSVYKGDTNALLNVKYAEPGGMSQFKFGLLCNKTRHRKFVINAVDDIGLQTRILESRIRMQRTSCVTHKMEFQGFTDVEGDSFTIDHEKTGGYKTFSVYVNCGKANDCEGDVRR